MVIILRSDNWVEIVFKWWSDEELFVPEVEVIWGQLLPISNYDRIEGDD